MIFAGVDIPDELLQAQQDGNLVVFAGAGVSIDPPSKLPDFSGLALELGKASSKLQREGETIDRYLGRLVDDGIRVHDRTRDLLSSTKSKPNDYHKSLLGLFRDLASIRIVTTNFDRHFSTVGLKRKLVGRNDIYYAPALPIGNEFKGIVYLHGSVDGYSEDFVLTDRDFSKAYITHGFARQFLLELFRDKIVLFIGYSHNDPILTYLARGLPRDKKPTRFTFAKIEDNQKWNNLGITPYPFADFDMLRNAIVEWANFCSMNHLDYDRYLQARLGKSVLGTLDPQDSSFLKHCVVTPDKTRLFTQYAKSPDWLFWSNEQNLLRPIFGLESADSQYIHQLSWWLAYTYLPTFEKDVFEVIQMHLKNGGRIVPEAWRNFAWPFAYGKETVDPKVLGRWVQLLIRFHEVRLDRDSLEQILLKCRADGNEDTAILIYEYLTRPEAIFEGSMAFLLAASEEEKQDARRFRVKISIKGNNHWLNDARKTVFQQKPEIYAGRLLPIIIRQFESASQLLRSCGDAGDVWDPISYSRSTIEPSDHNHGYEDMDQLVDLARESLDWLIQNDKDKATAYITLLLSSPAPLMQRLGIYGISKDLSRSPNSRIKLVIERDWVYSWPHHHEVFQLLKENYGKASTTTKKRLFAKVKMGPNYVREDERTPWLKAHSIYERAQWLKDSDPGSTLPDSIIESILAQYPEMQRSEHPDLTHWMGSAISGYDSPKTVDELKAMTSGEATRYVNEYEGEVRGSFNEYQEGLYRVAQFVIKQDVEWGLVFLGELAKLKGWEKDYWGTLIYGFREATPSEDQWGRLLDILEKIEPAYEKCLHSLADLLLEGLRRSEEGAIPGSLLEKADRIASKVYDLAKVETEDEGVTIDGNIDWMTSAINRPTGRIVEFWTHYMNKVLKTMEPKYPHIPENFRAKFEAVLSSPGFHGLLGVPIMMQQLWRFYALDKEWTKAWLLPLLEWHANEPKTFAAWDGYFYSRRWTQGMLDDMLPYYEAAFSHASSLQGGRKHDQFTNDIVSIAFYGGFNPLVDHDKWILRFLTKADFEVIESWAEGVTRSLENMLPDVKEEQWKKWLRKYWEMRLNGVPKPLTPGEKREMTEWAFHLEPVFEDAVAMVTRLTSVTSAEHSIFYDLADRGEMKNYPPKPLARYLSHILKAQESPFWSCDDMVKIFDYLVVGRASPEVLKDICNSLSRLGCSNALKLAESIGAA